MITVAYSHISLSGKWDSTQPQGTAEGKLWESSEKGASVKIIRTDGIIRQAYFKHNAKMEVNDHTVRFKEDDMLGDVVDMPEENHAINQK